MVKELLYAHGLEECQRRALVLFSLDAPSWLESRDLKTLVAHFDKLAIKANRGNGVGGHVLRGDEEYPDGVQDL